MGQDVEAFGGDSKSCSARPALKFATYNRVLSIEHVLDAGDSQVYPGLPAMLVSSETESATGHPLVVRLGEAYVWVRSSCHIQRSFGWVRAGARTVLPLLVLHLASLASHDASVAGRDRCCPMTATGSLPALWARSVATPPEA